MMPEKPIGLVVSDIDGTLVTKAKVLTPRVKAAIEGLKARGIGFSVASARPPVGLRSVIANLGVINPVGAVNGGAIINPDLSIIKESFVPVEAVKITIETLRKQGLNPWLFTPEAWYCREPDGAHVDHEANTIGQKATIVHDFAEADLHRCLKLVGASHDHPLLAEIEEILQAELGGKASATRSQVYYLDVVHSGANKGEAVRGIAEAMNIPLDRVLTIGDGDNDTPMFGVSGFSVAMGNASEAVKNLAKVVTDTNEADGFAKAIERYVLEA